MKKLIESIKKHHGGSSDYFEYIARLDRQFMEAIRTQEIPAGTYKIKPRRISHHSPKFLSWPWWK